MRKRAITGETGTLHNILIYWHMTLFVLTDTSCLRHHYMLKTLRASKLLARFLVLTVALMKVFRVVRP